jgi:serine/threonine protein phosphatase PrpC
MKEQKSKVPVVAAVISDRGLSKKRPLNEDSFLSDPQRRIFAVADGVGGAQAGEVASQTAMEVLDEAFRHQEDGADIEDLLEIAIQRANTSIHRMSQEHPKLSMMATTVVALHLDGHLATIGHVGDSRLYRLDAQGQLHRETADHSVVEEEVRAGRMTPEQASNHPSRNVISRALGAEDGVEVDLKTIEVEDGTCFLLCSDGITRHIPDNEIREIIHGSLTDLEAACDEMKRRCFERGAEDNLTAVLVRVGDPDRTITPEDDEHTLIAARSNLHTTMPGNDNSKAPAPQPQAVAAASTAGVAAAATSQAPETDAVKFSPTPEVTLAQTTPPRRSAFRSLVRALFFLIVLGGIGAGAFYGGMYYQKNINWTARMGPVPTASPEQAQTPVTESEFERQRREVDKDPVAALTRMSSEASGDAFQSSNPQFLYFYGRALFLTKDYKGALQAFNNALKKLDEQLAMDTNPLKLETLYAKIAAGYKAGNIAEVTNALTAIDKLNPNLGGAAPNKTNAK